MCVCVYQFSSVHSLSHVRLFVTPWTAAHQASLSITNSQSLLKLMSIELVIHPAISSPVIPFPSCPQSFPATQSFQMSQLFALGGQSIGVSASTSVLPMNIQGWFPSGLTGLISLVSKGLSRVFSSSTVRKQQFFSIQPSSWFNSRNHIWLLEMLIKNKTHTYTSRSTHLEEEGRCLLHLHVLHSGLHLCPRWGSMQSFLWGTQSGLLCALSPHCRNCRTKAGGPGMPSTTILPWLRTLLFP